MTLNRWNEEKIVKADPNFRDNTVQQALERLTRRGIAVRHYGFLPVATGLYPFIEVDATTRPDVRDLPRVHVGTDGDFRCTWEFLGPRRQPRIACLGVDLWRPVRCSYSLGFDLEVWRNWLDVLAEVGGFIQVTDHYEFAAEAVRKGLLVTLDVEPLQAVLDGRCERKL